MKLHFPFLTLALLFATASGSHVQGARGREQTNPTGEPAGGPAGQVRPVNEAEAERLSKQGQTLSEEFTQSFALAEQRIDHDTGINVLVDLAHQASFAAMWTLPPELRRHGFRAVGSQATLDTVLVPGTRCRVRIPVGSRRPFAWWPAARWNVVLSFQNGPQPQPYLPEERRALLEFVRAGGGLILAGDHVKDPERLGRWTVQQLATALGAAFSTEPDQAEGSRVGTLKLGPEWEVTLRGDQGKAVIGRRTFGQGRVVLISSSRLLFWDRKAPPTAVDSAVSRGGRLAGLIQWAAAGAPPAGGTLRLPREASGGGPIYPELEQDVGGVIVYYARNQSEELLNTVRTDMTTVKKQIEAWLPSIPAEEPMYLIVSAGGGGGWAVNAYLPRETGVISASSHGLLSVFAHELAHTMGGPPNAAGALAASWPQGNQGESHAGWFQGKINALFNEADRVKSNRDCNRLFSFDRTGAELDLAMDREAYQKKWGKGKEWTKIWWIWQKLDDRYGPTWYPRWRWVQHTRWQNQPRKQLSWDETVQDMSIAVGEDLFPFFRKTGMSLLNDRFEHATFQGAPLHLPVAPLDLSPAGPVQLGPIGDYKKPPRPASD